MLDLPQLPEELLILQLIQTTLQNIMLQLLAVMFGKLQTPAQRGILFLISTVHTQLGVYLWIQITQMLFMLEQEKTILNAALAGVMEFTEVRTVAKTLQI